jgi:hypothetical protein
MQTYCQFTINSPPLSTRLTNSIKFKQHFTWSALGWMTARQHQSPMGVWCILSCLKGPTVQLARFTVPTHPDEAPVPILSPRSLTFQNRTLCTSNNSQTYILRH